MKTIFKSLSAVVFVLSAVLLPGCDKAGKYLNVTPREIVFTSAEGYASVRVAASSSWMFSSSGNWLTCEYVTDDDNLIMVKAVINEDPLSRASEVVITTSDGQMFTIPVSQSAPPPTPSETSETSENL